MRAANRNNQEQRAKQLSHNVKRGGVAGYGPAQIRLQSETMRQQKKQHSLPQSHVQTQQANQASKQYAPLAAAPGEFENKEKQFLKKPRSKEHLQQDYMVICKVLEAKLSKDQSTFFSSMNVYCEVRFQNTQINWTQNYQNGENQKNQIIKNTATATGQNPKWEEEFSFNYQKLTKTGIRHLKNIQQQMQNEELKNNMQQLDFTLYKKTMLFTSEKIGETTVQLHNASSGSQTDWLILTNEQEEIVGKLLTFIEIKKDNTSLQIRQIQNDLKQQDNMNSADSAVLPGMTSDMTEDKGMPLRNHEQVLLLNERSEPITHITHQTQNSAVAIGGLGNLGKSPKLSTSIGGQQNRGTSNSIMGATNITHVSNPAVGACGQIAPLYLETTNIIPQSKLGKKSELRDEYEDYDSQEDSEDDGGEEEMEVHSDEEEQVTQQRAQTTKGRAQQSHARPRIKALPQSDNIDGQAEDSSMLMAGMGILGIGVVATQHIREEYDEDEEYEDEDDDEEDEEEEGYEGLQIGMIDETPPVNEGGGPSTSTGVLNTHGNQYGGSGQNTGGRQTIGGLSQQPMAVGEVVLSGPGVENQLLEEEDDESNINSDEHNEYLENNISQHHYVQNQYIMRHDNVHDGQNQGRHEQRPQHATQSRHQSGRPQAMRPNTATSHASYAQQKQLRLLQQSQSAMNIRQPPSQPGNPQKFQYAQYQSQKIDQHQKNARAQQISGDNAGSTGTQSRSLNRGDRSTNQLQHPVQRMNTQQSNRNFQSTKNPHGAIPKGPSQNKRQAKKEQLFVEGQPSNNLQVNINTIDVEPSFRSRQNMFHHQSQEHIHSAHASNSNLNGANRSTQQYKGPGTSAQAIARQDGSIGRGGASTSQNQQKLKGMKNLNSGYQQSKHTAGFNSSYLNRQGDHNIHHSYNQNRQMNFTPQNCSQFFNTNIPNTQMHTQMVDDDENEVLVPDRTGARTQQRARAARAPEQKQHHSNINEFNIGQVDDADLLQNQSVQNGSQQPSDEYQVNSEGDEDQYPRSRQQQFGGPIVHSPVPKGNQRRATEAEAASPRTGFAQDQKKSLSLSQSRSKKKKRRQPSQEPLIVSGGQVLQQNYVQGTEPAGVDGGSTQLGANPLEHETFSMQQQDTFHQKQNQSQEAQQHQPLYHPPGFAPGGQMQQFEAHGSHNYVSSPLQGPEPAKHMSSMGNHPRPAAGYMMRPNTQQTMINQNGLMVPNDFGDSEDQNKTILAIQYKQNAKNVNRAKGNGPGGLHMNASMAQANDHSVIQHITSHSSHNSEEPASGAAGPAFGQAPRRAGQGNGRNRQVHHSGLPLKAPHYPYNNKTGGPIAVGGGSTEYLYENEQQQQQASLMQQYNSFQEVYEDYMSQNIQQIGGNQQHDIDMNQYVKNSNKKMRHVQHQYSDVDSSKKSDPLSQMAIMNNRALSHEMQLNQMHQNIIQQVEKIRKEKAHIKNEKARIKEENMNLITKQQQLEAKTQQLQKQFLSLKREKLIVKNEMNKVKSVYHSFAEMLQKQYPQQSTLQISEQLNSIKMLLELLMNDREIQRQDSQFNLEAETADFDGGQQHSGDKKEEVKVSSPDQIVQYQQKLESLCNLYQRKIEEIGQNEVKNISKEEMALAWQNMQNLQAMTDQMRSQMEHINQINNQVQSSMATHMHQVQELVAQTPVTNGAQSPMLVGHNYPDQIHQNLVNVNTGLDSAHALQQQATPLISGEQTPLNQQACHDNLRDHLEEHHVFPNEAAPSQHILAQQADAPQSQFHMAGELDRPSYASASYPIDSAPHMLDPAAEGTNADHQPRLSEARASHRSGNQGDPSSSQMSEFVINPDPNFLAMINANIRNNKVTQNANANAADAAAEDEAPGCLPYERHLYGDSQQREAARPAAPAPANWAGTNQEEASQYQTSESADSEERRALEMQKQMLIDQALEAAEAAAADRRQQEQAEAAAQSGTQEARAPVAGGDQHQESNQMISDCGSNIEIEEVELKPNASVSVSVAQIEADNQDTIMHANSERVLRNADQDIQEERKQENPPANIVLQGAQGDDFKKMHSNASVQSSSASQMSVFQSIQQKLQKIGQNPNFKPVEARHQKPSDGEIESPNPTTKKDTKESDTDANRIATTQKQEAAGHASPQGNKKKIDNAEILRLIHENQDGEWPSPQESSEPDPLVQFKDQEIQDYYNQRLEQSVIYKDEKVYDQPHRAMYGIKKAEGKLF